MPVRREPNNNRHRRECAAEVKQFTQVLSAVDAERDNLSRAHSLLGCLRIAMEYGEAGANAPYYPDVVQMAGEMVRKSIGALDPIELSLTRRNSVKEEFLANKGVWAQVLRPVAPLPRPVAFPIPRPRALRLHRRLYSSATDRAGEA